MKKTQRLETLAAVNIALLLLFLYFRKNIFVSASILLTLACLLFPVVLFWVSRVWNAFSSFIGAVNARILLAIVYFLLLVPIAFFYKIAGKKKVNAKTDNYKTREHLFTPDDFERLG